ncbi:hypothetical protein TcasGA2_TC008346 [Tribolium castaneum]|uniref:Uncharacterized protein n=1 Tax=Tribolium castaneum TaxID=7070 RepID=D2A175_TRICA|nr:hypothetical protein TcasGA2_TC008346 [Tribolium castaneum]
MCGVYRYRLRHLLVFYRISKFFSKIAIFDEFQSSLTNEPAKIKLLRCIDRTSANNAHATYIKSEFGRVCTQPIKQNSCLLNVSCFGSHLRSKMTNAAACATKMCHLRSNTYRADVFRVLIKESQK